MREVRGEMEGDAVRTDSGEDGGSEEEDGGSESSEDEESIVKEARQGICRRCLIIETLAFVVIQTCNVKNVETVGSCR